MDLATARLTATTECLDLAERIRGFAPRDALRLGERLRRDGEPAARIAAAMTLAELRVEARPRLGAAADALLLHRAGLEQATRTQVAAMHADRFVRAGCRRVADLTAGLGLDARAIADRGIEVVAFELDPATALFATFNLSAWPHARVVHGDGLTGLPGLDGVDGVFADPARRTERGRRHAPDEYSPPLDAVLDLRHTVRALGVKAGPGLPHDAVPPDVEAEWVSVDGDVVEAGLWAGDASTGPGHAAMVVRDGVPHRLAGSTARGAAGPLGDWLLEPDGAVIRAGLVGVLAERVGAHLVDPRIAYLTTSSPVSTPFARAYRVIERMPLDPRTLARELRARDVGAVDIKKRGVDITPEQLRPRLRLAGSGRATLVLTRLLGEHAALLVEPA